MIGLFLGEKKLPFEILNKLKKRKIKYFIIDLTKNNKFKKDKNSFFISIGKFGKILKLIKSKNCKKVIFAGNISKPKISKLKLSYLVSSDRIHYPIYLSKVWLSNLAFFKFDGVPISRNNLVV